MRKFTVFTLFFLACFSVFGQTSSKAKIYVAPIEGIGKEADNDYFYKRLIYELILQFHKVVKSRFDGDYMFKGTIELVSGASATDSVEPSAIQQDNYTPVPESPYPPVMNIYGRREFFSMQTGDELYFFDSTGTDNTAPRSAAKETDHSENDAQEEGVKYYFKLEMTDNRTGEVISGQNFIFAAVGDSVDKSISVIVYNLLSDIPDVPSKRGDSRDRWMYFETSLLWLPRIYYGGYESVNLLNFGVKLGMELHFVSFMSVGAGVQITQEQIVTSAKTYNDLTLETPVSLKFVFNPGDKCALEPYGGAAWNYSLGNTVQPSMFSWFAGIQLGIKDKNETGMFVIDPRFSMDFYDSALPAENIKYQRYCIQLGLGYKFGVLQKIKKVK
jgi:hypothetical protein